MPCILIIDKTGSIKELNVKTYAKEDLYKKAGFKTADNFERSTTWNVELPSGSKYNISVYGKKSGRAGQENKYDFPPPIDNTLFFGSCVLVNHSEQDDTPISLTKKEWKVIYEHLFGGFEDIVSNDSNDDESEEEEEDDTIPKTKTGYVKDGFVVDDNATIDDDTEDDDTVSEDYISKKIKSAIKKTPKQPKSATLSKERKKKSTVFDMIESPPENTVLECSNELEEEEYV
jgi:hypothetical protein